MISTCDYRTISCNWLYVSCVKIMLKRYKVEPSFLRGMLMRTGRHKETPFFSKGVYVSCSIKGFSVWLRADQLRRGAISIDSSTFLNLLEALAVDHVFVGSEADSVPRR